MGRGNVRVTGQYEGLYYIDNDDLICFRPKDGPAVGDELDEFSLKEARNRVKEYRENCPQYPCKVVKEREPKEPLI